MILIIVLGKLLKFDLDEIQNYEDSNPQGCHGQGKISGK